MAAVTEDPSFVVRPAKSVKEARDLWWPLMQKLGWNRDYNDAQTHFAVTGKNGWLLLVPNETGKPEGCILPFTFTNGTGWVGFFIVNAAYRGNGWGRALFNALLAYYVANNATVVGLDGVEEQVKTYERRGFVKTGLIRLMTRPSLKESPFPTSSIKLTESAKLVDLRDVSLSLLTENDFAHTGLERSTLWTDEALFSRSDVFGYAIISSNEPIKLLGWVMVRRCEQGHRFGPLYADSYEQAYVLLRSAMEKIEESDGSMIAEAFPNNPQGVKVFQDLGWTWAGVDYHRMWLGGRVPKEQQKGGRGEKGMFAIFDAAQG
ncbi:hypothetical protein K432DRAFT_326797 [Lepidopterella palustris CBS 459.81]|uniref:N-acetyltransferase domain-containing protein n=1 Tax=Lepidopterella palustris CBS 459.81 TaxID=1314670 RepID=A0A8E2JG68_9PEZI|nr:hypothetical protein K432DRAFT_326797 [Lepidopterella palustris CBS 459.81]